MKTYLKLIPIVFILGAGCVRPDQPAAEDRVAAIEIISEHGGRVSWSADGEWLALDQVGEDGYFDIYVMRPETSNKRCLTCDKSPDIVPQKHNGTAEWHPSGDYLVFTAEKQKHPGGSLWAEPGKGVYNDIWLMKADGSEFWPLTDGPADNDHGSIHPHFSSDGKRLAWAEMHEGTRLNDPKKTIGSWYIKTADFTITPQGPQLTNVQTHEPGGVAFYENHGFSPDGSKLLFSSNFEATNLLEVALQANYVLDLQSGELTKLTVKGYNEQAHFTPDGSKVFWMSSRDNANRGTDYWMANSDGTDHQRVTFLNHPSVSNHLPKEVQYLCTDFSFHPDGKKLVSFLQTDLGPPVDGIIVIMELK